MNPGDAIGVPEDHPERAGLRDPALRAMAEAARRARDTGRGEVSSTGEARYVRSPGAEGTISRATAVAGEPGPDRAAPEPVRHGSPDTGGNAPLPPLPSPPLPPPLARPPRRRRLGRVAEAGILAAVVIAASVTIALSTGGTSTTSRTRSVARASPGPSATLLTPPKAPTSIPASPSPAPPLQPAPSSTTAPPVSVPPTTAASPTPGGAPEISSISPSSGSPGQVVVISGTNLISADGQILARFNGQPTQTRCPARTSCTITVPDMAPPASSVPVTVTTAAGTSNALTFSYG